MSPNSDTQTHAGEHRLDVLLGYVADAVFTLNIGDGVTWHNEALVSMTGVASAQLTRPGFLFEIIPTAEERDRLFADLLDAHSHPATPVAFTTRIIHADGTTRHIEGVVTNMVDDRSVSAYVFTARDMTDRIAAREIEDAARRRLSALFETSPDPVFMFDLDGRILWANRAVAELSGIPAIANVDELTGFISAVDQQWWSTAVDAARTNPGVAQPLRLVGHRDGREPVILVGFITDMTANPDVGAIVANLRDVTDQYNASLAATRKSEARWRSLLTHAAEALVLFNLADVDGSDETRIEIVYASEPVSNLIGITVDEFAADPEAVFDPAAVPVLIAVMRALEPGAASVPVTFRVDHRQLGWRWVEALVRDLRHDPAIGAYVANARDITDVLEAEDLAERSTARFQNVISSLIEGIAVVDVSGTIIELNHAAADMLGVDAADARGTKICEDPHRFYRAETDTYVTAPDVARFVAAGATHAGVELFIETGPDRHRRPVRVSVSPFDDPLSGEPYLAVCLVDISDEHASRKSLQVLVGEVSKLNADLQQVISVSAAERDRERRRIALELHDDAVQMIVATRWKIDEIRYLTARDPDESSLVIDEACNMLEQTVVALRSIIFDLRPPALDDRGLFSALTDFVFKMSAACAWSASAPTGGFGKDSPINPDIQALVWRTVCEAVRNTNRHAHATEASVELALVDGTVHCTIVDDGVGASAQALAEAASLGHIGLASMRESILAAGGTFAATVVDATAPRPGWKVSFTVPA